MMTFDSLRAGKVREDERLASYVLGTCRRMAIGLARSATRRQRLLERFGPELAPAVNSPNVRVVRHRALARLRGSMEAQA